ncbi:MAG: PleD family two-component system response regulator [Vampirovibrionia bacterium]
MRILVAENAIISSIMLEASLVKLGYNVVVAENGHVAREYLVSNSAPEMAILDWNMPGMSGLDVCRKVRNEQRNVYPYIIMITPSPKIKDVKEAIDSGADDYIHKPYFATELDVRIKAGMRIIRLQKELLFVKNQIEAKSLFAPLESEFLSVGNF